MKDNVRVLGTPILTNSKYMAYVQMLRTSYICSYVQLICILNKSLRREQSPRRVAQNKEE